LQSTAQKCLEPERSFDSVAELPGWHNHQQRLHWGGLSTSTALAIDATARSGSRILAAPFPSSLRWNAGHSDSGYTPEPVRQRALPSIFRGMYGSQTTEALGYQASWSRRADSPLATALPTGHPRPILNADDESFNRLDSPERCCMDLVRQSFPLTQMV